MNTDYNYSKDDFILIGTVNKAHGMKGEVKIYCYSEQPGNFSNYQHVILIDQTGNCSPHLKIKKSRTQGKMAITLLDTITDRNRAEHIEGMGVLIPKDDLPEAEQDEYYWHQLIGKTVINLNGESLGIIEEVFSNGAQDVMVVKSSVNELFIPIVADIVLNTDQERVLIDPPVGLLDMNKPT